MRIAVAVPPAAVVAVRYIFRDSTLPHVLQVGYQARLIFDGGYAGGGAGNKQGSGAAGYAGFG